MEKIVDESESKMEQFVDGSQSTSSKKKNKKLRASQLAEQTQNFINESKMEEVVDE